ncbi:TPA: S8 family serine peptidase [Morganella morganii]
MDNKINAYKIIGDTPAIYAEVDETRGKFTLALQKDDKAIKVLTDIVCGQVFSITSPGKYTLSVTYKDDIFYSDSICFYDNDFISETPYMNLLSGEKINLKTEELVSPDIKKFTIEVKINKGKKSILDKLLKKIKTFLIYRKKIIDLSTFSENHSIHNFEYYTLKTNLSSVNAIAECHKMEQDNDIIYVSVVPDTEYFVSSDIDITRNSDVMTGNAALTPDFSHLQTYLDEPRGMNIRKARALGTTGKNAIIRHIDFGIYKNHEEFKSGNITVVTSRSETEDCNHGTASVGCISAADNNSGVTGIAHSSHLYFYDVRESNNILNDARPGDIISFDVQYKINNQLLPGIAIKAFWDTVKNLTGKGAIVIAAAGNGKLDLSNRGVCPDYGDCGGFLVGASNPETGKRLGFSNYAHYSSLITHHSLTPGVLL